MLPSETMIWQPEFTDKTLSRKPGAVHNTFYATPACGRKLLPNVYPCQQALLSEARQPARKTI
ncbi:hypothetical protein ACNIU6_24660, partial [Escherichia coli]